MTAQEELDHLFSPQSVSRVARRMRDVWTRESQQDLNAYRNFDAEAELARILADEINAEIDQGIISDMRITVSLPSIPDAEYIPLFPDRNYRHANTEQIFRQRRHLEKSGTVNWKREGF